MRERLAAVALAADDATDFSPPGVARSTAPVAPERMASLHPAGAVARREAQALYERCLHHYRTLAGANSAADDDVGAALARLVAASLDALQRDDGPMAALRPGAMSAPLLPLERQLGGALRQSATWSQASIADQQFYFEQVAILSVLIRETSIQAAFQGPAATANVQRAARGYVRQLLGIDPDLLALGPRGLTLRPSAVSAATAGA